MITVELSPADLALIQNALKSHEDAPKLAHQTLFYASQVMALTGGDSESFEGKNVRDLLETKAAIAAGQASDRKQKADALRARLLDAVNRQSAHAMRRAA